MKLRLQAVSLLILLMLSGSALGLGVGRLEQNSALNEIFDARIPLLSSSPDELASLKVRLADSEAFDRAGIERNAAVNLLKFDIVEPASGEDYIHVTSRDPIREPFLSFLLEISWSSGRLFREYTVLLDPPAYEPQSRQAAAPATPRQTTAPTATESRYSHEVQYPDSSPASPAAAPRAAAPRIDGDYGPTQTGDTLWSIANSMRPAGVSNQQMMLALLRANPDAFIGNNVNGLKRGQVLRAPDSDEMRAMDSAAALEEIKRQYSLWDQAREAVAASPAQQPDTATAAPAAASPASTEAETTESRLEVLAAADGESDTSSDAAADDADLNRELAIASENLEAVAQENAELKDRLAENEALIEDLKRLIALKDDELASLQSQMARDAAGVATAEDEDAAAAEAEAEAMAAAEEAEARAAAMAAQQAEQEAALQEAEEQEQAEYEAAEQAEAEAAMADDEIDEAPAAAPGDSILDKATGILDKVLGILGVAVGFVMGNLMLVGAALLALLVLIGGGMFMSRRSAEKNDAGAAGLGEDEFPDFAAGMSADQTSFDDEESVTEINAAADDAESPTEVSGMAAEQAPEDDGFEIPVSESSGQFEAPEEDPLAEVNVLMAYEHFDQAEEFVRNRLKSEPDDIESHAKLLEVFYASNNKKKYEDTAAKLKELTGGEGEHWDMAVAMWQEISPNRALFEAGGPEEDDAAAAQPASAGIVDITGDSTGGVTPTPSGDDGGLDFDFSDSAAGAASTPDDSGDDDMLDLTAASSEEDDGDMLDLTAASGEAETDDNMLEMTAASVPPEDQDDDNSLEMTVSISKKETDDDLGLLDITASADDEDQSEAATAAGSEPVAEDDALDLSFDTSSDSDDLLDVTSEGSLESEEDSGDLLDVTSSMKSAPEVADDLDAELSDDSSNADDGMSLDFSLDDDDDKPKAEAPASAGTATADDNMLDFDMEFSSTGTESESADVDDVDEAQSLEDDLGALDDIGAELDKLEESMGMLSADETKAGFGDTSDALEGIDDALGDMDKESSAGETKAGFGNTSDALEGIDDALGDMDSESNDDMDLSDLATGLESELDSLGADDDASTESSESIDEADDDLAALSIELEDSDSDSDLSGDDLASDLDAMLSTDAADDSADEGLSIDLDSDADAGDELSFDTDSDLSADLDSDLSSDLEVDLDAGPADAADDDLSLDTLQPDVEAGADDDDGFSFDIDTSDSGSGGNDMDMDSTVEMPKDRLATSQLVLDEDDGDDRTVFVPRSSRTDEQSLEDELTTKLDLAKAYVELGDSDSARGILQEIMDQGNDKQKQEAGELLQQLD